MILEKRILHNMIILEEQAEWDRWVKKVKEPHKKEYKDIHVNTHVASETG